MSSFGPEEDRLANLAARQNQLDSRINALVAERDLLRQENSGRLSSYSQHTHPSQSPHPSQLPSRSRSRGSREEGRLREIESHEESRSEELLRRPRRRDPVIHVSHVPFPRTSVLERLSYSAQSSSRDRPLRRDRPRDPAHVRLERHGENQRRRTVDQPSPYLRQGATGLPSVFGRLTRENSRAAEVSAEEMEKRLRSELKEEMMEMMKANGLSGNSSARSLIKGSESPFSENIQTCPVPKRFRPPTLESYDGSTDPLDHWQLYTATMGLQDVPEGIICRTFITTLKGSARMWYNNLAPRSVRSLDDLGTSFLGHFLGTRTRSKSSSHLFTIKQEVSESLKDYSRRFNKESLTISNLNDGVAIAAFLEGVTSTFCLVELSRQPPKTMPELLEEVNRQIGVEERLRGRNISAFSSTALAPKGKEDRKSPLGQEGKSKRSKKNKEQTSPAKRGGLQQYTPLTLPVGEVFAELGEGKLPEPKKSKTPDKKKDVTRYCRYHKDHGHDTNDCWKLKEEIEKLIQRGQLRQYVNRSDAVTRKDKTKDPVEEILMIEGGSSFSGSSNRQRKAYVRKAQTHEREVGIFHFRPFKTPRNEQTDLTFTDEDLNGVEHPHDDPLVITALVGNHNIHRILVDTGATSNLMYQGAFKAMGLTSAHLTQSATTLVGFSGERTRSLGTIRLSVTFGTAPRQVTTMADFLVLNKNPNYNVILGRGTLNEIRSAVSTYHLVMRFPTPNGIGEVRGNQVVARHCYFSAMKEPLPAEVMNVEELGPAGALVEKEGIPTEDLEIDTLDPRDEEKEIRGEPAEEMEELTPDPSYPDRRLQISNQLSPAQRADLVRCLQGNLDVFAWSHNDVKGLNPKVMVHRLNADPAFKPVRQKKRTFAAERNQAAKEEVQKLLEAGFIREVQYPLWLSNIVLVKKHSGKWRMCVDFKDLNKACPKDSFPLPKIDQLVDATTGHEMLSFMDAYSGYNQVRMAPEDEEKTSFVTNEGTYCYKAMPFGLRNAGATYQRVMSSLFRAQIGRTMEVYVDDMLVKSLKSSTHVTDLAEAFEVLRKNGMSLNPAKCAFGVQGGKFLGFMVTKRGIEANPEKIQALIDMKSPTKVREVQSLAGRVAALNRFISKATDKCHPFFKTLKKAFEWTEECEHAFQQLKTYLGSPPLLGSPRKGETLSLYLAVSPTAVSSALMRTEEGRQFPIYYTSRALRCAEVNYPKLEKLAYALLITSRKLRHYFQAHAIEVLTDQPLRRVLDKPDQSGRLAIWAVELGQFVITYKPRTSVKGQAVADFIAEFTYEEKVLEEPLQLQPPAEPNTSSSQQPLELLPEVPVWILHADGASNKRGSGAGLLLITPEGNTLEAALKFEFKATNNEAEYEAVIAGLRTAKYLGADQVIVYNDSSVVIGQLLGTNLAKEEHMAAYLAVALTEVRRYKKVIFIKIPRAQNNRADRLAKLASSPEIPQGTTVQHILQKSIQPRGTEVIMAPVQVCHCWIDPLLNYLRDGTLPEDKKLARRTKYASNRFIIIEGALHKRGYVLPYLLCLHPHQAQSALMEVHEGLCGGHAAARALALKVGRQGYYWPTILKDAKELVQKCDKCQRFANVQHLPAEQMTPVSSPWPFSQWGIDLVGPFPIGKGQTKFAVVAIDYFTKWVEAEALASITSMSMQTFVWKSIICRFGLPKVLITDNGRQFDCEPFRRFCEGHGIENHYSSPVHPQANGQVEVTNRTLLGALKKRLGDAKGRWAEELPSVLWAYRTSVRGPTGETPFSLTYGTEAVIPVELGIPTYRVSCFDPTTNEDGLLANLDLLEGRREQARVKEEAYKKSMVRSYNKKVKLRTLQVGDLALRKVNLHTRIAEHGKLAAKWEGPYVISRIGRPGTYYLKNAEGAELVRPWNIEHLKKYYP